MRDSSPPPSLADSEVVNLHFFLKKKTSRKAQLQLGRQLEREGMKVQFHEFSDETSEPLISVDLSVGQFKKTFQGQLEYRQEERSATRGTYYQLYVVRHVIPRRFKPLLKQVMQPDPQMY